MAPDPLSDMLLMRVFFPYVFFATLVNEQSSVMRFKLSNSQTQVQNITITPACLILLFVQISPNTQAQY
jgi:hypothetical protein